MIDTSFEIVLRYFNVSLFENLMSLSCAGKCVVNMFTSCRAGKGVVNKVTGMFRSKDGERN